MSDELKPEWEEVARRVSSAEASQRQAVNASRELYDETGLRVRQREGMLPDDVLDYARRKRVARAALTSEEIYKKEAEDILSEDSPERALVNLQKSELAKALRANKELETEKLKLLLEEEDLLRGINGPPTDSEQKALDEIRADLAKINKAWGELLNSSPEAFYGLSLQELKKLKTDLMLGRIVETSYVQDKAEDSLAHYRAGKPILIYGHLGSGKTEFAMHFARKYIGADALVISGSKHTTLAEFYGHQILTLDRFDKEELRGFTAEVESEYNKWVSDNLSLRQSGRFGDEYEYYNKASGQRLTLEEGDAEKNRAHDRILQTALVHLKSGTISEYFLGPIYRAMQEGRPVIIDEVNAIPHEVLISLNHILTRKPGDVINVQQNSGTSITIKEGFGIIMTGNLNQGAERYIDRQDMDPAFLSRLYKIEYDYLPQTTEGGLEDEASPKNELFALMVAKIMDRYGNIKAPADTLRKLWNLAKAARVTQDVFAGREISSAYYFQEAGARATRYILQESVMSIRAIDNILTQWQKDSYRYELDYYIWNEFVSQSTVASDKAYLYQLLKDRFGFFEGSEDSADMESPRGWPQNPNYGNGGMVSTFDVTAPKINAAPQGFMGPRQVVEAVFGKPPERAQWPDLLNIQSSEPELDPKIAELLAFQTVIDERMHLLTNEVASHENITVEQLAKKAGIRLD